MDDDILSEVRAAREAFGELHRFNVRAMVADLQAQDAVGDWPVVNLRAIQSSGSAPISQQPTRSAISIPRAMDTRQITPAD